jgi:apolipoprotein N-acyltransferase
LGDRAGFLIRAGWGAVFALLLFLCFPFRLGEVRFDLGGVAGWIALVPFVLMLEGLRPGAAFRWAVGAATAAFAGILFWIFVVVHVHGHGAVWVAVGAVLLLALYVALHIGVAASLFVALRPRAGPFALLVLPAAWVVCEHLRTFDLFGGFPWAYLGYAVHGDGPVLELAAFVGVWGLSFLLAAFAVLVAQRRFVVAMGLLAAVHGLGFGLRVANSQPTPDDAYSVALVQASIPQEEKWDPELAWVGFEKHLTLSRLAAAASELDLILWPEAAAPVLLQLEPRYAGAVQQLADETGAILVLGGVGFERLSLPQSGRDYQIFNSVFAVTPESGFVDRYDKSHLVPFGEYVPLRKLLSFLSAVASGIAMGDLTPGSGPRTFRNLTPGGPDHALAPLICYEVIYPSLVRKAVRSGARVLLNLTNDAWYGRTSAPHQFLAIAAMRSAEHGLPMLRAANTGVSAIIDAGGMVLHETPIFEQHALPGRLPEARSGPTVYTRYGDWVVWASWGFLIGIGGFGLVRRGRPANQGDSAGSR